MNPNLYSYLALFLAVVCEVAGTAFLHQSNEFTRVGPTCLMAALYLGSIFFLTQALRVLPLGIAYSLWGSLGIVLASVIGYVVLKQKLDLAAMFGIAMIIGGVVFIQLFSSTVPH